MDYIGKKFLLVIDVFKTLRKFMTFEIKIHIFKVTIMSKKN